MHHSERCAKPASTLDSRPEAGGAEGQARRELLCEDLDIFSAETLLWCSKDHLEADEALADRVRQAVRLSLTEKQREAVEGYYFEGMSQGQLAERLGVAQQVIHKRLFGVERQGKRIGGALARLRAVLSPELSAYKLRAESSVSGSERSLRPCDGY